MDYDRTADLHKITEPTLVICGRYDEATPESAEMYASKMLNTKLSIVEDAAHLAMIEKAEIYMDALEQFLATI